MEDITIITSYYDEYGECGIQLTTAPTIREAVLEMTYDLAVTYTMDKRWRLKRIFTEIGMNNGDGCGLIISIITTKGEIIFRCDTEDFK